MIPAQLNIFSQPRVQSAILGHNITAHKPVNALTLPLSTLEFVSTGNSEFYRDLSETYLQLTVCLRSEDGGAPILDQDVACVNNLISSLFSCLEVFLNEKCVCRIDHYAYKAFIETLLNYSSEAANTHLTTSMFHLDTPRHIDTPGDANVGFAKRKQLLSGGKNCQLFARLRCGLFDQPLFLLNGFDLRLKFTFHPEAFYMWGVEATNGIRLHVTDATLFCKNVALSPPLLMSHARVLAQTHATYPMKRVESKTYTTAPGSRNITLNSVCSGRLPTFMCMVMIDNTTFNGNRQRNSFSFVHKSVTSISIFVNSVEHKLDHIDFHSLEQKWATAYHSLFTATGADMRPSPLMITPEMFSKGTFLVCKDFSRDASGNLTHTSVPLNGELRIEISFANPLDSALTCLVLLEHDCIMEIDAARNILIS